MEIDQSTWDLFQNHLGYSDEEMKVFKKNPGNADVISKGAALMNKTIVVEVVESKGCNSQHKVGDKFYLDGAGNLITGMNPKRICIYALSSMASLVFVADELFYAGVDPNEIRFKRVSCPDVGVQCGGWGQIVMEISVVDRKR